MARVVALLVLTAALGSGSGCERGCIRVVSLAAKSAAENYLDATADAHARAVRTAMYAGGESAATRVLKTLRTADTIDEGIAALDAGERALALIWLLGQDDPDDRVIARRLLASRGFDPFRAAPTGQVPFADAIVRDHAVARLMLPMLDRFPHSRPSATVLCGLRGQEIPAFTGKLRRFCPCKHDG